MSILKVYRHRPKLLVYVCVETRQPLRNIHLLPSGSLTLYKVTAGVYFAGIDGFQHEYALTIGSMPIDLQYTHVYRDQKLISQEIKKLKLKFIVITVFVVLKNDIGRRF